MFQSKDWKEIMVEKFMVEEFIVEEFMVKKSGVEARGWNGLQPAIRHMNVSPINASSKSSSNVRPTNKSISSTES